MTLLFAFVAFALPPDTLSPYARGLVSTALAEHAAYHRLKETDPVFCEQIRKYWQVVGTTVTECVTNPWSAVFVSYCVKTAGATPAEFRFADAHSQFVYEAIRNTDREEGVFRARPVNAYAPRPGDIIQANRTRVRIDFEHARRDSSYASHGAIVVRTGKGLFQKYAETIGGNERDTVRKSRVKLRKNGLIKQRKRKPYICIIQTLK